MSTSTQIKAVFDVLVSNVAPHERRPLLMLFCAGVSTGLRIAEESNQPDALPPRTQKALLAAAREVLHLVATPIDTRRTH